jgi:large subunit ribosomal protein L34e
MVQRLHLRRRNPYKSPGNLVQVKKTPGNKLVYVPRKKRGKAPKCGGCGTRLSGIAARRPAEFSRLKKSRRTVARVYGGVQCGACVQAKIIGAFLGEEENLVREAGLAEE